MKERPILFSAPMVRALLAGVKTQTRRVVKPAPYEAPEVRGAMRHPGVAIFGSLARMAVGDEWTCPYGQPGDRLWVRETHAPQADCWGAWERWLRGDGGPAPVIHYAADFKPFQDGQGFTIRKPFIEKWRPSIHMPRWASRITLEVTDVRVERLQDISEADAIAEGIEPFTDFLPSGHWRRYDKATFNSYVSSPVGSYASLWESINGPGSWETNPWVWSVSFKVVTP